MLGPVIKRTGEILRPVLLQLLFVFAAFALMVITTYVYVSDIERKSLKHSSMEALTYTESNISSYLLEPETALYTVAETIRGMIFMGYGFERLADYIKDITHYIGNDERLLMDATVFYGVFDAYDGQFFNGMGWVPPGDFVPQEYAWYKIAIEAEGNVGITDPYLNESLGMVIITLARQLFDDEGNSLGVVALDVTLNRIRRYATETQATSGSYGMLLDREFRIIAHPSALYWGRLLGDVNDGGGVVDLLKEGMPVSEHKMMDYRGRLSVVFMRPMNNGWYLGIVAPESAYYQSVKNLALMLSLIGLVMATTLNVALVRISAARARADTESRQKSNFLAMMSHEIRTPMNAILGIAEIQIQNKTLPHDTSEALNKIYNSGYSLLGIINDVLDFSKIEAGKLVLTPSKYDVASLIHDTTQLNMMRIGSKLIKFNLQVDPFTPSELIGDELRIKQILNNLLSNAFKYTDAGEVVLSITTKREDRVRDPYASLIFHVSDTGQGMTKDQVGKLFEEYSRFQEKANRAIEGTGLGMNITKRLIELMNGTISVTSEPGRGSIFTVCLPQGISGNDVLGTDLAENLRQFRFASISQKTAQIVRDPMPYGKVLIVDDVETNLYVAKGLMAPYGLSIETSSSGFGAVEKVKEGNVYDIIFMDHMMPKMDGIEATKIIRETGYKNSIVALTANAVAGQAEVFLTRGFDDFISKPIDIRQLNAMLNKLVRDKQPPEVLEAVRGKNKEPGSAEEAPKPSIDPELAGIFVRDAEKAVQTLQAIHDKRDALSSEELQLYIVNVHAMKSALANIGEAEFSDMAQMLESAGREQDVDLVVAETPAFLTGLRAVIDRVRPQEDDGSHVEKDDREFLLEKLIVFRAACTVYDKKAAKDILNELKEKNWTRTTREMINTLTERLLHSEFEDAANIARDYELDG